MMFSSLICARLWMLVYLQFIKCDLVFIWLMVTANKFGKAVLKTQRMLESFNILENTKGVNVPCSNWSTRLLYDLFSSLVYCMALLQRLVQISTGIWVKYPYIEKCLLTSFSKSTCSNIESCFIWSTCCFPRSPYLNRANKFDSIPVSLQTSDTTFAARCRKSLSPMLTKPPFLQFMLSWISNLLPHGQNVGIFVISQQYRKLTQSQNCRFDSSKPCSVTGSIVSQFDTPFSVLILTSRFFSFINLRYQFL